MIIIAHGSDKVGTSSTIMGRDITTGQKEDAVTVQHREDLVTALQLYNSTVNTLNTLQEYWKWKSDPKVQ